MDLSDDTNLDPQGWVTPNDFDVLLEKHHSFVMKPRKKDGKLRLSWSLLKLGLTCPRAATWNTYPEKFGIDPEKLKFTDSLASLRGNFAQTLLEHTYAHNFLELPPEQLVSALQASWRWSVRFYNPLRVISDKELTNMRTEVFGNLPKMFGAINREGFWSVRQEVEKPLWWDIPAVSGTRLTGKADFVLLDPGKFWIIDGKYVKNTATLDHRQLTFYAIILQKMTGRTANRAIFWCYPQDTIIDYSSEILTPYAFHLVLQDVAKVATQIKGLDITAQPSRYTCRWCSHREHCNEVEA